MTEKQLKSGLRMSHRWVGLVAALLLLVTAITGFLLQHPGWLGPPANPVLTMAADPATPGRLLRGNHWGVEQSNDGGKTWAEVPMLAPPTDVVRILFSHDDPRTVHALGRDALVVSTDGGRVWSEIYLEDADLEPGTDYLDLTVGSSGELSLLTDDGLLTSSDGGASWDRIYVSTESQQTSIYSFMHDLHTGHLLGAAGRRVVEFGALALVFITITGVVLFRRGGKLSRR